VTDDLREWDAGLSGGGPRDHTRLEQHEVHTIALKAREEVHLPSVRVGVLGTGQDGGLGVPYEGETDALLVCLVFDILRAGLG
jgi:hypothetical protein